ncbi:MAG: hypothetical protein K0S33_4103 [Bacteroidetes bacterium]|jgi:uncharacterized YigZ family protein|nr:hypothetical protein [Bacteroidota bacterium]
MLFSDTYFSIEKETQALFRDKGSKFIAYAYPVKNEAEIKERMAALKKEHPSANHHCYAYRLGADKQNYRSNDDGEPTGTAGKPILGQIQSKDLTDILIVVVRYFGGTLLGVSGLINAYKTAAAEVIAASLIVEKHIRFVYSVHFPFARMNDVMRILKENNCKIIRQDATDSCEIEFAVRKQNSEKLEEQLRLLFDASFKFLRQE